MYIRREAPRTEAGGAFAFTFSDIIFVSVIVTELEKLPVLKMTSFMFMMGRLNLPP
ncbi:hypothetical protein [Bacillus sp. JJ675]|uniref:hypothetical protein n=1 Tax=Bacillus sp. JJ675 TaxID=3122972 RepID=UPI0008153A9A|nr:putative membrane protein [Bacillus glycinifermentans]